MPELNDIAQTLLSGEQNIQLIYAFNSTGKTQLSLAYKDLTKDEEGNHVGVYYNALSEDLFTWDNGDDNDEGKIKLLVKESSLNSFHGFLNEENLEQHLERFKFNFDYRFNQHEDSEKGIQSIEFSERSDNPDTERKTIKVSRGEERIFLWCFYLSLFEVEELADNQSEHIFIDDPVSSLDDHNIFITASTIFDLIEKHYEDRKIILTTHHMGLFSILSDWLRKGELSSKLKGKYKMHILSKKSGEVKLETCRKDVFLYHLRLLQVLETARRQNDLRAFHLALLRQVLENISSFLGVGRVSYVLEQIGIDDANRVTNIVNSLSHKNIYYYESDDLVSDNEEMLIEILDKLMIKYEFVLHLPRT